MPIKPENRHYYQAPAYIAAREEARRRSGDTCERCGAPNGKTVLRAFAYWTPASLEATVFYLRGTIAGKEITVLPWQYGPTPRPAHFPRHEGMKWQYIQCGASHQDQNPANNDPANVLWLCRACHLRHDARFHAPKARETRQGNKDQARPLLQML
jgi:hypothetical protein